MKYLLGLLVVGLLFSAGQPTVAETACIGVVTAVPQGLGLPVMEQPTWDSLFMGVNLTAGTQVQVVETRYNKSLGDVWFRLAEGWIQAYSGYTTGFSQVILADFSCSKSLPHTVGE